MHAWPPSLHTSLALVITCLVTSGCVMDLQPEVGELQAGQCRSQDSDPEIEVSFAADILPIFTREQGPGCGCHLSTSPSASGIRLVGLDLTEYGPLMRGGDNSRQTIVVPGDPCASILLQKVSAGPPFGSRMPSNGPPYLSHDDRQLLSDWIAEGAHDN